MRHNNLSLRADLLITRSEILGQFARYAVIQSPYTVPENLGAAIEQLAAQLPTWEAGMSRFGTLLELQTLLFDIFIGIRPILDWNKPKVNCGATIVASSRYDQPHPDHDFIDLDALARNVARGCWQEAADFEDFNNDFEERRKNGFAGDAVPLTPNDDEVDDTHDGTSKANE